MYKIIQIILFSLLLSSAVIAQKTTISGYVQDKETGEKLIGANVYDFISMKGTSTNNFGFYSLSIPKTDTIKLAVTFIGYKMQKKVLIQISENLTINFDLQQENILHEVDVFASRLKPIQQRTEMSIIEIPVKQIKTLPALGGEVDVMKAMQLMPGVQSGNEGSSGLYVRGGSPDQNLILLDDVPLYYLNHLGGFVSVFNADAINNVKLIKGGFPAQYGSRLSSIVDIRMKDGNLKKKQGQGTIGLISSKISLEGPIKKDTTSYIISVRRFLLDLIARPLSKIVTDDISTGYTFYDINAKFNHKFSYKDRLYFSFYTGNDKMITKRKGKDSFDNEIIKSNLKWGNMLSALRWNHLYNQKLFSNLTLTYTRYRYLSEYTSSNKSDGIKTEYLNAFNSSINDFSGKIDFEFFMNSSCKIKFGLNTIYHNFTPGIASYKHTETNTLQVDTSFNNQRFNAFENAIYFENIFEVGKRLKTNIGLRASNYIISKNDYYSIEPRILINYLVTNRLSVKASFSSMKQYVHLLSYSGIGLPSDLWVPATNKVPPENSYQYALGIAQSFYHNLIEFSIESYYKQLENLITFSEGASFLGNSKDWQEKVETGGKGKSYGVELLLQKKEGKLTGWIGYTLSKTERQFENINFGNSYPYRYDRRHDISIVINYKINESINISGTWVYGSGNAITLPIGYHQVIGYTYNEVTGTIEPSYYYKAEIYKSKNGFRMRDYHKLDIGISFTKPKRWGERTLNLSIYNLYNRQNPYYYFFDYITENGKTTKKLFQQSLFPIIPSVSYSFKF